MVTAPERWERQRRTFERTAEAYDRYRPSYPDALFDDIRRYADLAPEDDRILEIACGTGKATEKIAGWPNRILALEPAASMADVARAKLTAHDNVAVLTTSFEDWQLEPNAFGLVICAQAWHWLDPDTRAQRIAGTLYAHGTVAIVANVQVVPEPQHTTFFQRVLDVYREHTPHMTHEGPFRTPDDIPPHPLEDSPLFTDFEQARHPWSWTLPTSDYIALMTTHSNHAAMDDDVRARLHAGIAKLIDTEFGGAVTEDYVAVAGLARRA